MTIENDLAAVAADPLQALACPSPRFAGAEVSSLIRDRYGLKATLRPLVSERDQNFHAVCDDSSEFVIKIANSVEPEDVTDFQIQALLHIERSGCPVPVPRVLRTQDGAIATEIRDGDVAHICRVVSYLPGTPIADLAQSATLAENLGVSLAQLGIALADFEHAGDRQVLLWDLQRAGALHGLLGYIHERELHDRVAACLVDFEQRVAPYLAALRGQVIHSDAHGSNVLAGQDGETITGIIDFGDMLRAPLIMDVAIAAAYLRGEGADPLQLITPFVAGYHGVMRLDALEIDLLFDLVRARLAATITISRWRIAARGADDAYSLESAASERSAEHFLAALDGTARARFTARIRAACGLPKARA